MHPNWSGNASWFTSIGGVRVVIVLFAHSIHLLFRGSCVITTCHRIAHRLFSLVFISSLCSALPNLQTMPFAVEIKKISNRRFCRDSNQGSLFHELFVTSPPPPGGRCCRKSICVDRTHVCIALTRAIYKQPQIGRYCCNIGHQLRLCPYLGSKRDRFVPYVDVQWN